jgi:hypothetical protein
VGVWRVSYRDGASRTWSEIVVVADSLGMDQTHILEYLERDRLADYSLRDRTIIGIEKVIEVAHEDNLHDSK